MATRITRTLRHLASATTERGRRMIGPRLSDLGDRASGLALRWRDDLRENPAGRIVVQLMDDLVQRLRQYARQLDPGDAASPEPRRSRGSRRESTAAARPARSRQVGRAIAASPSGAPADAPKGNTTRRSRADEATATGTRSRNSATTGGSSGRRQSTAAEEGARAASPRKSEDSSAAGSRKRAGAPSASAQGTQGKRKEGAGSTSTSSTRTRNSRSKTEGGRPRTP